MFTAKTQGKKIIKISLHLSKLRARVAYYSTHGGQLSISATQHNTGLKYELHNSNLLSNLTTTTTRFSNIIWEQATLLGAVTFSTDKSQTFHLMFIDHISRKGTAIDHARLSICFHSGF